MLIAPTNASCVRAAVHHQRLSWRARICARLSSALQRAGSWSGGKQLARPSNLAALANGLAARGASADGHLCTHSLRPRQGAEAQWARCAHHHRYTWFSASIHFQPQFCIPPHPPTAAVHSSSRHPATQALALPLRPAACYELCLKSLRLNQLSVTCERRKRELRIRRCAQRCGICTEAGRCGMWQPRWSCGRPAGPSPPCHPPLCRRRAG